MPQPIAGRVASHIGVLSLLWGVMSVLLLLRGGGHLAGAEFLRHFGAVWWRHAHWDWSPIEWIPGIVAAVGVVTIAVAILGILAAWGLSQREPWARTLVIILAVLALFQPVAGTLLGAYTLWVMLPAGSDAEYRRLQSRA